MHTLSTMIDPTIQTIIWDLDGTLLDSFGIYRDCLNDVLRQAGYIEASEDILRHNHHGTIEDSIQGVVEDLKLTINKAELNALIQAFFILDNAYIKDVDNHLFDDAVTLAQHLHDAGKRQIIVTNRAHGTDRQNASPRTMVQHSRLRDVINDVICGDDSEYRKPTRKVLEARFGNDLNDLGSSLVIGDQFVDATFAHNIGCKAILVNRTGTIAHLEKIKKWKEFVHIVPSCTAIKC